MQADGETPVCFSAASGAVSVAGRRAGRPVSATLQLCGTAGPCAAPAAACVRSPGNGTPLIADAGRITNDTGQSGAAWEPLPDTAPLVSRLAAIFLIFGK